MQDAGERWGGAGADDRGVVAPEAVGVALCGGGAGVWSVTFDDHAGGGEAGA